MKKHLFKHITQLRVRNYEIDWQGIVHNANYLLFFEVGRIEYLKHIGLKLNLSSIQTDSRVVLVRNEIDYKNSAQFDDLLNIYTRVSYIKNTSFAFEGIIEDETAGRLIAENIAYHVWLHPKTGKPIRVRKDFRDKVGAFEGKNLRLIGEKK
ncbi:MAG TPA: thioesterase family protein [Bacteroidota bacterium]|nr:thioesterase family protein [Bacteroidota bacterium]